MKNDRGLTESARVKKINELPGERYRNRVSGRQYLMINEASGFCTLEGVDRHVIEVALETLDNPNSAWERIV